MLPRASDNSQEKKSNFVGFLETNSWRKRLISLEFSGQISPKNKEESQEERFQKKKKDILEGCQIQGKKENTKVHPTQFSNTCFELQEKHKLNTQPFSAAI